MKRDSGAESLIARRIECSLRTPHLHPLLGRRALHNPRVGTEQRRNPESRAKDARCIRTLTFDPLPCRERGRQRARLRTALCRGREDNAALLAGRGWTTRAGYGRLSLLGEET